MSVSIVGRKLKFENGLDELKELCLNLEGLMLSIDNRSEVKHNVEIVGKKYDEFVNVYRGLVSVLDKDEIQPFLEKFDSATTNHHELMTRTDDWLHLDGISDTKSVASESSKSHISHVSAMRKKHLAAAKLLRLKKCHEYDLKELQLRQERELIQSQFELEQAKIEEHCAEALVSDNIDKIKNYDVIYELNSNNNHALGQRSKEAAPSAGPTNHCAPEAYNTATSQNQTDTMASLGSFLGKLLVCNELPKLELVGFDGSPNKYPKFIHSFNVNVDGRDLDCRTKMQYLLKCCSGKAATCIEPYIYHEPVRGYQLALRALKERFGMPHVIARTHLEGIVYGPDLKPGDTEGLEKLASDMCNCEIVLSGLGRVSELNTDDCLRKIVKKLPYNLRAKWVDKAYHIIDNKNREANFSELYEFIGNCVKRNKTMYGYDLLNDSRSSRAKLTNERSNPRFHTTSCAIEGVSDNHGINPTQNYQSKQTYTMKFSSCICCGKTCKKLESCQTYKNMQINERYTFNRDNKLCYNCLKPSHLAKDCQEPQGCKVSDCRLKHNYLLHRWVNSSATKRVNENAQQSNYQDQNKVQDTTTYPQSNINCSSTTCKNNRKVSMSILPIQVQGKDNKMVHTYALLDSGSDISLCNEGLLKKLGIQGKPKHFSITTVNGEKTTRFGSEVTLRIQPYGGGDSMTMNKVWTVSKLPVSIEGLADENCIKQWSHLKDIKIPKIDEDKVSVLIGSDMPELLCPIDYKRGGPGEPCGIKYSLGWTVVGPLSAGKSSSCNINFQQSFTDGLLNKQVERFWKTEFSDLQTSGPTMSFNDKCALKKMEKSIGVVDGKYCIALPWREEEPELRNNKSMAFARLNMLARKLEKDDGMYEKYKETINDYINKGYARRLNSDEMFNTTKKQWYLPHHPVVNENKPGKIRVVFDCAAKFQGNSLNDKLLSGPDLVNSLVGVLIRFRQERIAIVSDIEAMFHQVKVDPKDHDALRFLWWEEGKIGNKINEYCMQVHLFGATSSPSCAAYALKRTAADQIEHYDPLTIQTVNKAFYVDDCLKSVSNENTAVQLVQELRSLLSNRGFRLTKWLSNNRAVLKHIPEAERSTRLPSYEFDQLPCERALGVSWDIERDCLQFKVKLNKKPETRRGILSIVSSIFDPIGLVAPVTLKAKLIFQNLCRQNKGWDQEISEHDRAQWRKWLSELPALGNILIPRCIKGLKFENTVKREIHIFSDASEFGFGACAYLRLVNEFNEKHVTLVLGKSRLAPIKQLSIPRLELSAAVVSSRLKQMIVDELELKIDQFIFWTDSTIVLSYLRNVNKRFKTFVANRLSTIQENTCVKEWRHVPGNLNPADLSSRGIAAQDEKSIKLWINGPLFLLQEPSQWPTESASLPDVSAEDVEVKTVNVITDSIDMGKLWEATHSFQKLKRIVAWLIRYKNFCINRYLSNRQLKPQITSKDLSVSELRVAEDEILKLVQYEMYSCEIKKLRQNREVNLSSSVIKLTPFLENGLMKVGGRINASSLDYNLRHPIILPSQHLVTKNIILECHNNNGHSGLNTTLTILRRKYWITRGIGAVKSVIYKCFNCRRRLAEPCKQQMAQLPEERLIPDKPPFTYIGVDYFGPILVRFGRGTCKRYGCLFTCLTTRAVHIEISHALDTDSFICAFRRFTSRRGNPVKVFSDNATNFTSGQKELQWSVNAFNDLKINKEFTQREIEWHYFPPHAKHMGGVYERLIRSVKTNLKALAGEQILTDEYLLTFMAEVERILNDRPITYVSCDASDPEPLSPSMLLLLRANHSLPPGLFPTEERNYPVRRWKQVQYLASVFWKRWLAEYIPNLISYQKWQRLHQDIKPGDIVLVIEKTHMPRGKWPIAIVEETIPSSDGLIRSAKIRYRGSVLMRPVTSLCMLEASSNSDRH